jgi:hypothetical protein
VGRARLSDGNTVVPLGHVQVISSVLWRS